MDIDREIPAPPPAHRIPSEDEGDTAGASLISCSPHIQSWFEHFFGADIINRIPEGAEMVSMGDVFALLGDEHTRVPRRIPPHRGLTSHASSHCPGTPWYFTERLCDAEDGSTLMFLQTSVEKQSNGSFTAPVLDRHGVTMYACARASGASLCFYSFFC